ncbi:MAG: DNA polymerase III subunit alpha [Hormoscilla sp. GM7CHS1pb]|nr:DNA polymerase III subunit alpha [Hormoscilla sp. GM7CHS1pb]
MDFVGLHIHSDYSLLDGASQLPELVSRAKELGMEAIALTDHGVMYGAIELIKVCRSKNIRPIIGNEMYVINETIKNHKGKYSHHHQTVLAKNTQGYKNLVKLTTKSHLEGKRGSGIFARPCITKELLAEYHEGLIVTSGCRAGEVPKLILNDRAGEAWEVAKWYKEIFGDDYYLEIQDHGYQEDRIVNVKIWDMAQKLEIKVVATNDSHYIDCYDVEAHDALLCINTNKLFNDEKRTFRYSGTEYLKSADEMKHLFRDHLPDKAIEEAIANTVEVADKVQAYDIMGAPRIPNYQKEGHTADSFLEEKAWSGLLKRKDCQNRKELETRYPEYKERLETELKVIQEKKFSSYFLVVWDYIDYARENHIPVGPGRGSAAGSLVAYALKITNIDPVHHGLLFERFLNPERKSMPDIDSDFCIERRDDMIKYVTDKYGKEKVAQIITFNRMTSKAVLKDVARVLGVSYGDADRMAKLIPVARGKPAKLKKMISDESPEPKFKEAYENDKVKVKDDRGEITGEIPVRQWIDMAMRLEGTNKSAGVHAAGVVISAEPLDEIVPLQKNNEGAAITQYSMEELESLGLLKMDFLGLKNLTIIQNTVELIKENHKLDIDPDQLPLQERKARDIIAKGTVKKIPPDIKKTYELLGKGDLEGIFQLESSGIRQVVQKLKPDNIEDISSILALYRPGPLDAGLVDKFIYRKHGREKIAYEHPMLEPILKETYGVLVYQEQIMKVAQDLAGYSLGQADLLRRSIGKKKPEEMQKHREKFIDGSAQNGIHTAVAESFFAQMVKFAEYCFNKSHSTAYAYVTYQTAYLKANYPEEYMAVLLSENSDDQDKVQKYIANCKKMGIEVEGPDINRSGVKFRPEGKKILFGLSAVKNLGTNAIESIIKARKEGGEFQDLAAMCDRLDLQAVNKRALEALIKCGACDRINSNRHQLAEYIPKVTEWAQKNKNSLNSGLQMTLFDMENFKRPAPELPVFKDFTVQEKLQFEKEYLGYYVSAHPLTSVQRPDDVINLDVLEEQKGKPQIKVLVMLTEVKQHITKKGDRMAFMQIEDLTGKAEAIVFPKTYEKIEKLLVTDKAIVLTGKPDRQDEQKVQLIVDNAEKPEQQRMLSASQWEPESDSPPPEEQLMSDEPEQSEEIESRSSDSQPSEQQLLNLQPQWEPEIESRSSSDQQEIEMEPQSAPEENKSIANSDQRLVRVRKAQQSYVFPDSDHFRSPTQTKGEIDRQKLQHLKSVQLTAKKLGLDPINLSQLSQQHPQVTVRVVATIADVHQQEHKPEGDLLTFLLLEDLNGSGVAMIKPDLYRKIGSSLAEDSFVILWGKAQQQDAERWWLMVSDAVQIEPNYVVVLKLNDKMASSKTFQNQLSSRLKDLSGETHKPKVPVLAIVEGKDFHMRRVIRFGHDFWVQDPENAVKIIASLNVLRNNQVLLKSLAQ